jgi:hypothetical protein
MDSEPLHKAIVNRWFGEFWGEQSNLSVVDELASVDVVLAYPLTSRGFRHVTWKAHVVWQRHAWLTAGAGGCIGVR